jgi:hypothetical protein
MSVAIEPSMSNATPDRNESGETNVTHKATMQAIRALGVRVSYREGEYCVAGYFTTDRVDAIGTARHIAGLKYSAGSTDTESATQPKRSN